MGVMVPVWLLADLNLLWEIANRPPPATR